MFFNVQKKDENTHIVSGKEVTKDDYVKLSKDASLFDHSSYFNSIDNFFNVDSTKIKLFVDELALSTQIVIKQSKMLYLHGYLLYFSLSQYLKQNPLVDFVNIIETGTARGFSSICMAKALHDNKRDGKIYTIDVLPNNKKMFWNCIEDFTGEKTRPELLKKWNHLLEYIEFIQGDSKQILNDLHQKYFVPRVHFSFLDAQHTYSYLKHEMNWVKQRQEKGDVIVCDDYTTYHTGRQQYPGIIRAVDEFVEENKYNQNIFYGDDGDKERGYVHLVKND